jgi:DNA-binding transcriptional ArsR family regulator
LAEPFDARARLDALQSIFSTLAHPARRQILLVVHFRGGGMAAGDIARRFAHTWPTTSRHLRVLERAGLLAHEKRGRARYYRLDRERLALAAEWLAWFSNSPPDAGGAEGA